MARRRRLGRGALALAGAVAGVVPGMVPGAPKRNVLVAAGYVVGLLVAVGIATG